MGWREVSSLLCGGCVCVCGVCGVCVLVARSDYFRSMLLMGWREVSSLLCGGCGVCVLVACSDYFRSMLLVGWCEVSSLLLCCVHHSLCSHVMEWRAYSYQWRRRSSKLSSTSYTLTRALV